MKASNIHNLTDIDQGAHQACTSPLNRSLLPTDEQKESGNYKKGKVSLIGLDIAIENPTGSSRSGVDPTGTAWSIEMTNHYGYIENTKGADGEEVDVFIKNGISKVDGNIFVIHQNNEDGTFDEHKVIIGAKNKKEAEQIYLSNYKKGWTGLGKMVEYSIPSFKSKFLSKWGMKEVAKLRLIPMQRALLELSAVKIAPEKFTWMKYKGTKNKVLTHTKRNGDVIKTLLSTGDVFGHRTVKQRSTGKELAQIVLKADNMDLAYNLLIKSFNTYILKHSRTTVMPKAFKKPIDVRAIDKSPKVKPVAVKAPVNEKPISKLTEKFKKLGSEVLDHLNGLALGDGIGTRLKGNSPQLRVYIENDLPTVYLVVYDPDITKEVKTPELLGLLADMGTKGLYQGVMANTLSSIYWELRETFKLASTMFRPTREVTAKTYKSSKNPGHRYIKILLGNLDPSLSPNAPEPEISGKVIDLGDGYTYSVEEESTGFLGKYLTPIELKDAGVIMWKVSSEELDKQAMQTKATHQNSHFLDARWDSPWGTVTNVYLSDAPRLNERGSEMYTVDYEDGSSRNYYGTDMAKTIETDELRSTPEWKAQNEKENESRKRALDKSKELKEFNDKIISEITKRITDWLDTTDYTKLQRGSILKTLLTRVQYRGTISGVLSREEFIRHMVNDLKAETSVREELAYKRPSRQRWNNMDAYEQEEYESRNRTHPAKTIYSIGKYDITKYEYLYAQYLLSNTN